MNGRAVFVAIASAALLASASAAEQTVFLVRHAEKADAAADPKNPELSAQGQARAQSLARMLKDAQITAIFVSEYARTQQTADPVARASGVSVTAVPAKDTAALIDKLRASGGNALVVGHSNTLPEIIKALGVATPVAISESEYDNVFVWRRSAPGELLRLHY